MADIRTSKDFDFCRGSRNSRKPDLTAGELFWKLFSQHRPNILFEGSRASKPLCHSRVEKIAIFFGAALYLNWNRVAETFVSVFSNAVRHRKLVGVCVCVCEKRWLNALGKKKTNISTKKHQCSGLWCNVMCMKCSPFSQGCIFQVKAIQESKHILFGLHLSSEQVHTITTRKSCNARRKSSHKHRLSRSKYEHESDSISCRHRHQHCHKDFNTHRSNDNTTLGVDLSESCDFKNAPQTVCKIRSPQST